MRGKPNDFFDNTSSSAKQTTTQSISSGDDHGSSSESDESVQSFLGARTVNVFILSESIVNETPFGDYKPKGFDAYIWIKEDSTFQEVKEYLVQLGRPHIILLQAIYGPRPHWTEASPNAVVESTCQVLYAVEVRKDRRYTLGVVRTRRTDYPVAIFDSPNDARLSVLQALLSSPSRYHTDIKSITLYSGSQQVGEENYDYDSLNTSEASSFPTVFFVILSEPSQDFLDDASTGSIPPMLQMSFVGCRYLLQRSFDLKDFCLQIIHVSRALFHTIISLAKAITRALKGGSDDARALIERSPFLSRGINLLLKDMEKIMEDLESKSFQKEQIQLGVDKVFLGLCGEFLGAVTVRHSHKAFQDLARLDHEDEYKRLLGNPDGEHGSQLTPQHVIIGTKNEEHPPSGLPMGRTTSPTTGIPRGRLQKPDARVIAAQAGLENAVLLSDNPFWLVQSPQLTLTDLATLVSASQDATHSPLNTAIIAGIQQRVEEWEEQGHNLSSLTQMALRYLETSHTNAATLLSTLDIHEQLLLETKSAIRGVRDALSGLTFSPRYCLRLALVGNTGRGKSLFINSLIGRALVKTRDSLDSPGTPFPMTIEHVRGYTGNATLRVDPAYFHEYLRMVREWDMTSELPKYLPQTKMNSRQEQHLRMFRSYEFSFAEISSGDDEILRTQVMIGDLFELCSLLSGSGDRQWRRPGGTNWPRPIGNNWPKLSVQLKELDDVEDFQIIEISQGLHGPGRELHDLDAHRGALNEVDGVILVQLAQFGPSRTDFGRTGLKAEQAPVTLTVYIGDERPRLSDTGNFVTANPGLYLDSLRAEESLKSTSSLWDLNGSLSYMQGAAPMEYEAMRPFTYYLFGRNPGADDAYSGNEVMKIAQKMIRRCDYARVRDAVRGAIDSSIIWRRLREMVDLLARIVQVQRETCLLQNLSAANNTRSPVVPIFEYLLSIQSIAYEWRAALVKSLELTGEEIIRNVLVRSFDSVQHGLLSKVSYLHEHNQVLESPTKARDFFNELLQEVESELEEAQAEIIWHVQANARKLWITSLQDLGLKISQVAFTQKDMAIDAYQENLLRRLSTLSTSSLRSQVQKEFEDRIRLVLPETSELSPQFSEALSLAEKEFEIEVLGENTRGLKDVQLGSSHMIRLGAELINEMGLLVRMPIPVSRSYCPTDPDILEAAFPIIMDRNQVAETFSGRAFDLWKSILEQECRTSIRGVVRLIAERGMKCVGNFIKEKTGISSKREYLLDKPADTVVWDQLILLQASAVSACTGVHMLCLKLYKEMGFVSSENADWFEDSMRNAEIDLMMDEPDDDDEFDY